MNERYNKLNEILKQLKETNAEDTNILQALYAQVNLQENELVNREVNLKETTDYSPLSNAKLYGMYNKKVFNSLNSKEMLHLLQETHNRHMKENNLEVTRNAVLLADKELDGVYGYVCCEDDILFINKYMIEKSKFISPDVDFFNKDNVGKIIQFVLLHESTHVVQFENSISLALDEKMKEEKAVSGAATLINNANFFIADSLKDWIYPKLWEMKYDFHYMEHEANYTAFKKVESITPEKLKHTPEYQQYIMEAALLGLRFMPAKDGNNEAKIESRVLNIEKYLIEQLNYFASNSQAGDLKDKVVNIIDNFTRIDENGDSKLRTKLKAEITEMVNAFYKANKEYFASKDAADIPLEESREIL